MPQGDLLVFVCLGDSLTVGYQSARLSGIYPEYPYSAVLEGMTRAWLKENHKGKKDAIFVNMGINGDSTDGMLGRFDYSVTREKPDYVIIWGGLNDLSGGRTPSQVILNLELLIEKTREIKATPILCTLSPVEGSPHFNERIRELNSLIVEHCESNDVSWVDLFSALVSCDGKLTSRYSDDGAHLSIEGYSVVAETIFLEAVEPILKGFVGFS
ncbi:MAG: GDSL-type esterase/lipase family protein [Candidatus Bathyarchaeota archaeon]|nr:GDSL-type esterase/lipase family protein [Candidatus Bathyarchaeota archaeon]